MQWCDNVWAACIICTCVSGCPSRRSSGCRVSRMDCLCQVRHTCKLMTHFMAVFQNVVISTPTIFFYLKNFSLPQKTFVSDYFLSNFFPLWNYLFKNVSLPTGFGQVKEKTLPIKHWSALLLYWLNRIYTQHKHNITCMLWKVMQKLRWNFTKLHTCKSLYFCNNAPKIYSNKI